MRRLLRLLGFLFLLLALWMAYREARLYWERGPADLLPLGKVWYDLDPGSLNLVQAVTERYLWPPLWDPVTITLLQQPALLVFGLLALLLLVVTSAIGGRRPVVRSKAEGAGEEKGLGRRPPPRVLRRRPPPAD